VRGEIGIAVYPLEIVLEFEGDLFAGPDLFLQLFIAIRALEKIDGTITAARSSTPYIFIA